MHELYRERPPIKRKGVIVPKYVYIRNALNQNLLKKITFQRENVRSVHSSHFVVRLLQSITVSKQLDDRRYVDLVDDLAMDLAMSLKLTSSTYRGVAFENGPFYGRESTEVLIAHTEDFDLDKASKSWRRLEPIRFLMHPKTDLNMDIPLGQPTGSETGVSVITINIPMLALMWKKWWENELKVRPEAPRTVMQFVAMFVLPNMVFSQIELALFNRQMAYFRETPTMDSRVKDPFFMIRYEGKFDDAVGDLFDQMLRKRAGWDEMLRNLFTLNVQDMFDVMSLPDIAVTRQVIWAFTMARLPFFSYLLEFSALTNSRLNRSEMNHLRKNIRALRTDRAIDSALPRKEALKVKERLKTEIEAYL